MNGTKILHLDIETAPNVVFAWRAGWGLTISAENIIEERYVLGFSAIWEHERDSKVQHVFVHQTPEFKKNIHDDAGVIRAMWQLIDEADVIVVHNGAKFDIPWFNTRALLLGLTPPSYYKVFDTLKTAKKVFYFNSNKLDYINKMLGYEGKTAMSFNDWKAAWYGDLMALDKMAAYCDGDVLRLREVYRKIRSWDKKHPSLGAASESEVPVCNTCQSTHVQRRGTYQTSAGIFQRYVCADCGHNMRDNINQMTRKKKAATLRNLS